MALFSFHADIVKRSTGRSSVAAAAYRAGEKMRDERTGLTHDYTRKTGIVYSEIMLPENAPNEYEDRYIFWNAVEKADTRKDSQTARTIDVALQTEFDLQEQIEDLQKFIRDNFVSAGMCADYAIHDTGDGNPHAHIMLTMRHVTPEGFGGKNRDWNETPLLEGWRENWAEICNERFAQKGLDVRISHLSLEKQGIDREATIHVGVAGTHMEKRGIESDRAKINREIIERNKASEREKTPEATAEYIHELKEAYIIVEREALAIQHEINIVERERNMALRKAENITERTKLIQALKEQSSRSHEQAENYFTHEFAITPGQAPAEINRLESKAEEMEQAKKSLEDRLPQLLIDRENFQAEYHRILASVHRDRKRVLDKLEQLEKEISENLSPKERMARLKITSKLDEPEHEKIRLRERYRGR